MNMESRPVEVYPVHDYLRSRLCSLYENDSIFDRFECSWNGDDTYPTPQRIMLNTKHTHTPALTHTHTHTHTHTQRHLQYTCTRTMANAA